MDAVKFIEERNRMCGTMSEMWGVDAAQIVKNTEEWSAAHPRKTRQDVFLDQWPEARIYANRALSICPNTVCAWRCGKDGECVEETGTCDDCCREFWSQEVE